jgi:methylmalonyl-CoA mutase cobalamin-binding subunit
MADKGYGKVSSSIENIVRALESGKDVLLVSADQTNVNKMFTQIVGMLKERGTYDRIIKRNGLQVAEPKERLDGLFR